MKKSCCKSCRAGKRCEAKCSREKNPPASASEYQRTHWGERGKFSRKSGLAPNVGDGNLTVLGTLVSVVYRTKKGGDAALVDYEHEFEGRKPILAYNDSGLFIVGGGYRVTIRGIVG